MQQKSSSLFVDIPLNQLCWVFGVMKARISNKLTSFKEIAFKTIFIILSPFFQTTQYIKILQTEQ